MQGFLSYCDDSIMIKTSPAACVAVPESGITFLCTLAPTTGRNTLAFATLHRRPIASVRSQLSPLTPLRVGSLSPRKVRSLTGSDGACQFRWKKGAAERGLLLLNYVLQTLINQESETASESAEISPVVVDLNKNILVWIKANDVWMISVIRDNDMSPQ